MQWRQMLEMFFGRVNVNTKEEPWRTVLLMEKARTGLGPRLDLDGRSFTEALLNTLDSRQGLRVTDSRDMLFAHSAILGETEGDPNRRSLVEVDYNKSQAEVYRDIAKYAISMEGDYSILTFCESAVPGESLRTPMNIPSWAPNWMVKAPHTHTLGCVSV